MATEVDTLEISPEANILSSMISGTLFMLLKISPEANILSSMNNVPEIRASRVADIRAQIESGVYETEDKLDAALEGLLDEIG